MSRDADRKREEIIIAQTVEEAWFLACQKCIAEGYEYKIARGSFEGHTRKQLPYLTLKITAPWTRPLAVFWKGQAISTDKEVENYFASYLVNPDKTDKEEYTYGNRVAPYLPNIISILRETPGTNQATIEVGRPEDTLLEYPPCLRVLSWKVTSDGLQLTSFWRSWDGRNGFPMNVGGIQLLNELVCSETELPLGPLILYSDGFHIYDMSWRDFT